MCEIQDSGDACPERNDDFCSARVSVGDPFRPIVGCSQSQTSGVVQQSL